MSNPYVPVADVVDVQIRFTIAGSPCEFHFDFKWPSSVTVAVMQALGKLIVDWIITTVAPNMSNEIVFNDVYLTDLTTQTGPAFAWTTGSTSNLPVTGAGTPTPLGAQTALVISERTSSRGRSFRGRLYLPVIESATLTDARNYQATTTAFWLSAILIIIGNTALSGWEHVVVSKFANKAVRPAGVTTPIIEYVADQPVKTQRRRLK